MHPRLRRPIVPDYLVILEQRYRLLEIFGPCGLGLNDKLIELTLSFRLALLMQKDSKDSDNYSVLIQLG